jgi:hypothetical protein
MDIMHLQRLSFIMSVCMEQLGCHWMVLIFVKYTVEFLLKYVTQIQLWLEVYTNNGHFA